MYGKNIKNLAYNNFKSKIIFNSKFILTLCKLELRLNILLLRLCLVEKLLQSNFLIKKKKIKINCRDRHKNYLVLVGDTIEYKQIQKFKKKRLKQLN